MLSAHIPSFRIFALTGLLAATAALSACGTQTDDAVIDIAFIGTPGEPFETGLRLSPAAQQVRAATTEGLVSLDGNGDLVPALAERWIVTDDGLSYIFRLRNSEWPNGKPVTAAAVRDALLKTRQGLRGTSLGHDLAKMDEVLAMAGRVIEIRLDSPMPDFLQLLAQPEMGIAVGDQRGGPMTMRREGKVAVLSALPPGQRGLPEQAEWAASFRQIRLRALSAEQAIAAFGNGEVDVVLNGSLANLPLADIGPLSRGTVRLDPALGLFGLHVGSERGLMAEAGIREAVAMAIDRSDLMTRFNIGGWVPATRIIPPALAGNGAGPAERWADRTIEDRRGDARRRILIWRAANNRQDDELLPLTLLLPEGPGADRLLRELADDLEPIGIALQRAKAGTEPDLILIDRTARFSGTRWYLNQFNCSLDNGACSPLADDLVAEALMTPDPVQRGDLLAEAEAALLESNIYIPLGAPVRWSLVRGQIDGFSENRWSFHPLFPFSQRPI